MEREKTMKLSSVRISIRTYITLIINYPARFKKLQGLNHQLNTGQLKYLWHLDTECSSNKLILDSQVLCKAQCETKRWKLVPALEGPTRWVSCWVVWCGIRQNIQGIWIPNWIPLHVNSMMAVSRFSLAIAAGEMSAEEPGTGQCHQCRVPGKCPATLINWRS